MYFALFLSPFLQLLHKPPSSALNCFSHMSISYRRLLPQIITSPSPSPSPFSLDLAPAAVNVPACLYSCDPSCPDYNCTYPFQSSPPEYSLASGSPTNVNKIAAIATAALVLAIACFIIALKLRRNNNNSNNPTQEPPPDDQGQEEVEEGFIDAENENLALIHPIWFINTEGLQPSVINMISVCQYRKGEGLIEGNCCSVCLSEFEEGESVRLLPKCSHAFHIPCIDTWLRSRTSCPLCRAPIITQAVNSGSVSVTDRSGSEQQSAVEVEATVTAASEDNSSSGDGAEGDREGVNKTDGEEEGVVVERRRSVSMDASTITIASRRRGLTF